MENKDALMIRNFITLVESIEDKIKTVEKDPSIDNQLDEANAYVDLARSSKLVAGELESVLTALKGDSKLTKDLSLIRTNEELLAALKGNKISPLVKGAMDLHFLKSGTANTKLIDAAASNLTNNNIFRQTFAEDMLAGQVQYEKALKAEGYSNRAITSIVGKTKNIRPEELQNYAKQYKEIKGKKITTTPNGPKKPTDPSFISKIKNFTKTKGEELKKLLKSGKNWKTILAWGVGLGIPLSVLYWMVKDSGETIPQDLPPTPPTDSEWAPCIQNLINDKSGIVSVSPSGQISVLVTKTGNSEYDNAGGLKFYSNGRVWSSDNTKKGSWTCKGGEAQTNEMSLNEQTSTEIDSDVETMIDLLDFPVTSNDMQDALVMLKKYSTSPKGKEFLQSYKDAGVGGGSLKKSVSYITTTKASSARAKREMLGLISQIEGGKTTPTPTITPNPSTGGGIGDINITWDGEKTTEPVTPDVKSSEGTKKSSKFTDRDKFPYSFGHRGPIIKEVQICFGFKKKWQTGNFGPITLKKLQELYGTSEINEDTYKRIKEKCNPTSTTGTPAPTTPTTTTPVPTPTSTTPTSTTPTSTTKPISDEVKQEIRSNLKKRGIDGAYVYKGRDLTPDEQNYLIGYAKERGYEKFIPKEKMGPNDKYVFRKLKKK